MNLGDFIIEVRRNAPDMAIIGQILPKDMQFEMTDYFNNVGTWRIRLPVRHPMANFLTRPNWGIKVSKPDGSTIMSGSMTAWQYVASASDPAGSYVYEGTSDLHILQDRIIYPDPANPDPSTQTKSHHTMEANAEQLMRWFVLYHVSTWAHADRKHPMLYMGQNGNRGPIIKKSGRFQVLGDMVADIATLGNLGFKIEQRGSFLYFETYDVVDRSLEIRLDVGNNTLSSKEITTSAPTATHVLVAGQGDLTARQFYAATSADSLAASDLWGRRIERFIDQRQTENSTEHVNAANEMLTKEGKTGLVIRLVPYDDTTMKFGTDWGLGDRVSVVLRDTEVSAPVTGYRLVADSGGVKQAVILGDATAFDREAAARQALAKRVSVLERN